MRVSKYNGYIRLNDDYSLVYNNLTGALDIAGDELVDSIKELKDNQFQSQLLKKGYITEKTQDEEKEEYHNLIESLFEKKSTQKTHILILTYDCNLRCTYCYEQHLLENGQSWLDQTLTYEQIEQIFSVIDEFDKKGDRKEHPIVLFGGEPLLAKNKKIVEKIMEEGARRGRKISIITNGTAIPAYMPLLKKYEIDTIQITIDGPREVHNARRFTASGQGTYKVIMNNVQLLLDQEINVYVKVPIDNSNREYVPELFEEFNKRGWVEDPNFDIQIEPVFTPKNKPNDEYRRDQTMGEIFEMKQGEVPGDLGDDSSNLFYNIEKAIKTGKWTPKIAYCDASRLLFYDPLGHIYNCWEAIGQPELTVGEYIPELSFNEKYDKWAKRHVGNIDQCSECQYALLCGGGCAYGMYQASGDLSCANCYELKQVTLPKFIPYLYERYLKKILSK